MEIVSTTTDVEPSVIPAPKNKRGRKKDQEYIEPPPPEEPTEQIEESVQTAEPIEEATDNGRKKRASKGRGKRFFGEDEENTVGSTADAVPKSGRKRPRVKEEVVAIPVAKKRSRQGKTDSAEPDLPFDDPQQTEENISKEDIPFKYFDLSNPHTSKFPSPVVMLIDLWIRWLVLFLRRIDEINAWKRYSFQIIRNSLYGRRTGKITTKKMTRDSLNESVPMKDWDTVMLKSEDEQTVLKLLEWARIRNLSCSLRFFLYFLL
jgi:hypothetical protein